jgi:NAD(P)-dependent dehydrogenase (short-subunit alcohol dehydrogenase family)
VRSIASLIGANLSQERPATRTAVVTGATSGIGRWIALGLARAGFRVVLIARDQARADHARNWIMHEAPFASIELVLADLSSMACTRAAAREIAVRHPRLSLLVNNAGVFRARRERTHEGREMVLAVNHLAPFILTRELGQALQAGTPSRIVTVGSSTSDRARIDPANLELDRGWTMVRAYSRSKLAVMMATFETARLMSGTGVVANVVHPGAVATRLVRTKGVIGLSWRLMAPWLRSEQQGADTPLHVALAEDLASVTARYFKDRRTVAPNPRAVDAALVGQVWEATERLVSSG